MSTPGGPRTIPGNQAVVEPPESECDRYCFDRLEESKRESIPISRHRLAEELARKHKMRFSQAFDLVEAYCDEHSPATPEYLDREFLVPFLKLSGLLFAALAIIALIATVIMYRPGDPKFLIGIGLTVLFAIFASAGYVRGLLREFAAEK